MTTPTQAIEAMIDNLNSGRFQARSATGKNATKHYLKRLESNARPAHILENLVVLMQSRVFYIWVMDDGAPRNVTTENIQNLKNALATPESPKVHTSDGEKIQPSLF